MNTLVDSYNWFMILKKTEKHEKTLKKIILTSEPCVKHLFAGRNTQQSTFTYNTNS